MTLFEHETESIITAVRQRTIGNASAIAVKDVLASDVPHPIKTYFRMVAQSQLEDELAQYRAASRFNFEHPEVQSLQKQINSVLIMQYTFGREEFLQHLDDAVHLIINYMIRPQWTLKNYIFANGREASSSVVVNRLSYFDSYAYLKDLVCIYIKQKHIQSFTDSEFQKIIWKLDGEYIRRKTADEVAQLLTSTYNFLNYPSADDKFILPVKGLMKIFEDKGLVAAVRRLEEKENDGIAELTQSSLSGVLEEARQADGSFAVKQTWSGEPSTVEMIQQEIEATIETQFTANESNLDSVEFFIEDGDRKRFIKKIFRQSELAFLETLKRLDGLTSWKAASTFIDEIFIRYEVDPYSTEAERFVNAVRKRYQ